MEDQFKWWENADKLVSLRESGQEEAYLEILRQGVPAVIAGNKSPAEVERDAWWHFRRMGINTTGDPNGHEPGCARRDISEIRNPVRALQNAASWVAGRSRGATIAFPAWELVFVAGEAAFSEAVRERWRGYATFIDGRMIAMKDDPIWEYFGDFGRAWGLYFRAELSGGGLTLMRAGVSRKEAKALGILPSGYEAEPLPPGICEEHGSPGMLAQLWLEDENFRLCPEQPPVMIPRSEW
jgi:hypothetical protein